MPEDHKIKAIGQGRQIANSFSLIDSVAIQVISAACLTGYLTAEYVWPYIRRKFWGNSELQKRLRLGRQIDLSKHEEDLAYGVVHPDEIVTGFDDIGGNELAIERLQQVIAVLLSSNRPDRFMEMAASRLFSTPPGILLYGPPGCGKTMLARALAKESRVRFLSVSLATILDKWVGETEKYIEALFSLARKIAPVIIFIDEIEALTRKRGSGGLPGSGDREWSAGMKSQLLSQWDGLASNGVNQKIVILGATNRPQDIDEAFLRRMPLQIKVLLPDAQERRRILDIILGEECIKEYQLDVQMIATQSEGFSGSDLHEMGRRVILDASFSSNPSEVISTDSFLEQIASMRGEKFDCFAYR